MDMRTPVVSNGHSKGTVSMDMRTPVSLNGHTCNQGTVSMDTRTPVALNGHSHGTVSMDMRTPVAFGSGGSSSALSTRLPPDAMGCPRGARGAVTMGNGGSPAVPRRSPVTSRSIPLAMDPSGIPVNADPRSPMDTKEFKVDTFVSEDHRAAQYANGGQGEGMLAVDTRGSSLKIRSPVPSARALSSTMDSTELSLADIRLNPLNSNVSNLSNVSNVSNVRHNPTVDASNRGLPSMDTRRSPQNGDTRRSPNSYSNGTSVVARVSPLHCSNAASSASVNSDARRSPRGISRRLSYSDSHVASDTGGVTDDVMDDIMDDVTGSLDGHTILLHRPSIVKPSVSHIDFWPSCHNGALRASDAIFETFSILVSRANRWLSKFPEFEVLCCETVEKKVLYVKDIYAATMCFTDEDGLTLATDVKGFRVWYHQPTKEEHEPNPPLAYFDTMPQYLNPGEKHPKFESREHTVKRVNDHLRESPVPGKILSVETVTVKIAKEDWSSDMNLHTLQEQTHWFDEYNCHQLAFFRVFYAVGQPAFETIGIYDVAPDATDEGGIFNPAKYQSFSSLVRRATQWITNSTGIRVTNVQTLNTKYRKKCENQGKRFNTDKMFEFRIEERFRSYYLRIGYVQTLDRSMDPLINTLPKVVCRTYLPTRRTQAGGYENITEVLERVCQDLKSSGCAVFHIESVSFPEWITNPDMCERGERTFYDGEWYFNQDRDGNDIGPYRYVIVYGVRVYFDAPASHPLLQRRISMYSGNKHSCCVLS